MTGLIESTLNLSVTAIVILLFKRIFKNKLSAKWHVWIWALLAIRLVLPSLPESSFSIFNAIDIPESSVQINAKPSVTAEFSDSDVDRLIYGETQHMPSQPRENTSVSVPENIVTVETADEAYVERDNVEIKTDSISSVEIQTPKNESVPAYFEDKQHKTENNTINIDERWSVIQMN